MPQYANEVIMSLRLHGLLQIGSDDLGCEGVLITIRHEVLSLRKVLQNNDRVNLE